MASATDTQSFDRTLHQPPRIDKNGYIKDTSFKKVLGKNALEVEESLKVPDWWGGKGNPNARKTMTDLSAHRHNQRVPDISYDLDGDGLVGNRDYVLAKLFDKDGDGKLNASERRNAMEAIKGVSALTEFGNVTDCHCRESKASLHGASSSQVTIGGLGFFRNADRSWMQRTSLS